MIGWSGSNLGAHVDPLGSGGSTSKLPLGQAPLARGKQTWTFKMVRLRIW